MGDRTGIPWADATWNPIRGCSKASPGCQHCYAETMAARFSGPGLPYHGLITEQGHWSGRARLHPEKLDQPIRWRRPRIIFVNSMSDLFHPTLTIDEIKAVLNVMVAANRHTYLILTKRPIRAVEVLGDYFPTRHCVPWHIWLGVTGESQDYLDQRMEALVDHHPLLDKLQVNRFVSLEPLLGQVSMAKWLPVVNWVIAGCESGSKRHAQLDWFRQLRDECREAGVPYFLKQADLGSGLVKMPELDGRVYSETPARRGQ